MNAKPTITTTDWTRNDGAQSTLKQPTLNELLAITFDERQYLLWPWLREQESCMVYAAAGVGKSLFALSAAIAVAGGGSFLGWKVGGRAEPTSKLVSPIRPPANHGRPLQKADHP